MHWIATRNDNFANRLMSDCIFKTTDERRGELYGFACIQCGSPSWSRHADPAKLRRECPARATIAGPKLPPLRERLKNFTVAALGHVLAGAPTCTDEKIAERLAICRACPEFIRDSDNPQVGHCAKCGCPASDLLSRYVSKIAWADQQCPLGKWPPIEP